MTTCTQCRNEIVPISSQSVGIGTLHQHDLDTCFVELYTGVHEDGYEEEVMCFFCSELCKKEFEAKWIKAE